MKKRSDMTRNRRRCAAALMLGCFLPTTALGLPIAPQVANGTAAMSVSGNAMTITNSVNAIINWNSFSIAPGESTRFIQPSAQSAVLNRITGGDASSILGALQSNGTVLLVNPNGILIGAGARIDVKSLFASTLNISDQDFKAGRMKFSAGPVAGTVANHGTITTPGGGSVYLIAPEVTNTGVITAPNGDLLLAAGRELLLVDPATPEIALVVSAPEHLAMNLGTLVADAGRIGMYGGIVRQKGLISADSAVRDAAGRIFLKATREVTVDSGSTTTANGAHGGDITVQASEGTSLIGGSIQTKGSDGEGGIVRLLGQKVGLIGQATVAVSGTTGGGTAMIGGDYQGNNPEVQNAVATYLGQDTTIIADASNHGDGGSVTVWADGTTRAYGSISARGGVNGGNGGFVETSGKEYLQLGGLVDTRAPQGKSGTLLLDPTDITITALGGAPSSGSFSLVSPDEIFDGGTSPASTMGWDSINGLLSSNNVIIKTTSSGVGAGNINFAQPGVSAGGAHSLSFQAENNITIGGSIQFTSSGSLTLAAGGSITQLQAAPIRAAVLATRSGLGTLLDDPSNEISSFSASNTGSGNIQLANRVPLLINGNNIVQSGGGNVAITNNGPINTVGWIQTTGSGNISLTASGGSATIGNSLIAGDGAGTGAVNISATGTGSDISLNVINVYSGSTGGGGGAIYLNAGRNIGINAAVNTLGNVSLYAGGTITETAGTAGIKAADLTAESTGGMSFPNTGYNGSQTVTLLNSGTGNITYTSTVGGTLNLSANNGATNGSIEVTEATGNLNIAANTGVTGPLSIKAAGTITQSAGALLTSLALNAEGASVTLTEANPVGVISGMATSGDFRYKSINGIAVSTVSGVAGITASGVVSLEAGNGIGQSAPITATGLALTSQAGNISLPGNNMVDKFTAYASSGSLDFRNAKALAVTSINGTNGVTVPAGAVAITSQGPLTIDVPIMAGGDISLSTGTPVMGITTDIMTINAPLTSTGGNISLSAGNQILEYAAVTPGSGMAVSRYPNLNAPPLPSLTDCIANPSLAGCSSVLPSLEACIATPSLPGCSVVLPTITACTANPSLPGCSVVLPSFSACIADPSLPGCAVVLPSVSACTLTPTLPGCSVVLPSLDACMVSPSLPGCSVVLPSLSACTLTPTLPGCSVMLPSLSACTTAPSLPGCSAVLPSLATCTADPWLPGCSVVLPSLSACTATPTLPGCSIVLPSVSTCIADPSLPGCAVVLPSVSACTVTPTLPGCLVVLPSLDYCIASPAVPGCSVVLPSVSACTLTPTLPGCSVALPTITACMATPSLPGCAVVLPSVSACTVTPTLPGCSVVLPSLSACAATPSLPGCAVVLPSLSACISAPSLPGCSAVLPSLSACTATPTLPGCSMVLPTLAQCTITPTLLGCAVVLPPVSQCTIDPAAAGCQVVLPPTQMQTTEPVSQVINSIINIINTPPSVKLESIPVFGSTRPTLSQDPPPGSPQAPPASPSDTSGPADKNDQIKKDDKKDEKSNTAIAKDTGAKKDEPVKKLYCN